MVVELWAFFLSIEVDKGGSEDGAGLRRQLPASPFHLSLNYLDNLVDFTFELHYVIYHILYISLSKAL